MFRVETSILLLVTGTSARGRCRIPNSSHHLYLDQPSTFNKRVLDFLDALGGWDHHRRMVPPSQEEQSRRGGAYHVPHSEAPRLPTSFGSMQSLVDGPNDADHADDSTPTRKRPGCAQTISATGQPADHHHVTILDGGLD